MGSRRVHPASSSAGRHAVGTGNWRHDETICSRRDNPLLEFSHFWIIPDKNIHNDRTNILTNMIQAMYVPLGKRWNGRGWDPVSVFGWEISLIPDEITFNIAVSEKWRDVVQKQVGVAWGRSTIKQIADPLSRFKPAVAGVVELKEHYIFPLSTDRRSLAPLDSILDVTNLMSPLDRGIIQILLSPAPEDWWEYGADAYDQFREGNMPKRVQFDSKTFVNMSLKVITSAVLEGFYLFQEFLGIDPERVDLNYKSKGREVREGVVGRSIPEKLRSNVFETTIRIGIESNDKKRAQSIMRALGFALRELDADNALVLKETNPISALKLMQSRRHPLYKINHDYLHEGEVLKLVQMPTNSLQQQYHIRRIEFLETNIPEILTKEGLFIGETSYKGKLTPIYLPINNKDELCLPHCVIGGMGTGKSLGFAANTAVEALRNGFSAIVIDPAKGEIGDELEKVVSKDKLVRFEFGKKAYSLDWREVSHAERARSRLANAMIEFFDVASDPAGAQTVRHLRSACRIVPDNSVESVIRVFTDEAYLKSLLPSMSDIDKTTWEPYLMAGGTAQNADSRPCL